MANANKTDIWMPVYIGDYLSATTRLTTEQHGAYLLLLMDYWKNGPPPDDDRVLAQITRMSENAWSNARSILEQFFKVSENKWTHVRVERELVDAEKRKTTANLRAKAGAQARWAKTNASSITQAMPDPMLADASSPSPSPSPSSKERKTKTKPSVVERPPDVDEKVWQDYMATRKTAITQTGLALLEKEAQKAGITLEAALSECTLRGWTGFKAEWVQRKALTMRQQSEQRKQDHYNQIFGERSDDGRTIDATPLRLG